MEFTYIGGMEIKPTEGKIIHNMLNNPTINEVKRRIVDDLITRGISITRTTPDGTININYKDLPKSVKDQLNF